LYIKNQRERNKIGFNFLTLHKSKKSKISSQNSKDKETNSRETSKDKHLKTDNNITKNRISFLVSMPNSTKNKEKQEFKFTKNGLNLSKNEISEKNKNEIQRNTQFSPNIKLFNNNVSISLSNTPKVKENFHKKKNI